jgi:hypothetical protein
MGDAATLIPQADFVVVEQACQWKATPQMMAPFVEGAPWGGYTLWVRRPKP